MLTPPAVATLQVAVNLPALDPIKARDDHLGDDVASGSAWRSSCIAHVVDHKDVIACALSSRGSSAAKQDTMEEGVLQTKHC